MIVGIFMLISIGGHGGIGGNLILECISHGSGEVSDIITSACGTSQNIFIMVSDNFLFEQKVSLKLVIQVQRGYFVQSAVEPRDLLFHSQ